MSFNHLHTTRLNPGRLAPTVATHSPQQAKESRPPLPDAHGVPASAIPFFPSEDGKTIRRQFEDRYETVAAAVPTVVLAVAQRYIRARHGTDFTGWIVSGESTELYEGPIGHKPTALTALDARAARELALYENHPDSYPDVPEDEIAQCDRIPGPQHWNG
jgi:hypothetical protein